METKAGNHLHDQHGYFTLINENCIIVLANYRVFFLVFEKLPCYRQFWKLRTYTTWQQSILYYFSSVQKPLCKGYVHLHSHSLTTDKVRLVFDGEVQVHVTVKKWFWGPNAKSQILPLAFLCPKHALTKENTNKTKQKQPKYCIRGHFQDLLVLQRSITKSRKQNKTHTTISPLRNQRGIFTNITIMFKR